MIESWKMLQVICDKAQSISTENYSQLLLNFLELAYHMHYVHYQIHHYKTNIIENPKILQKSCYIYHSRCKSQIALLNTKLKKTK